MTSVSPGDLTSFSRDTFWEKPNWYKYPSGVQSQTLTFLRSDQSVLTWKMSIHNWQELHPCVNSWMSKLTSFGLMEHS